jgi:hypothetical protein
MPEARQHEIFERLGRDKLENVKAWLATQGVRTSTRMLSHFYNWRQGRLERRAAAERIKEELLGYVRMVTKIKKQRTS